MFLCFVLAVSVAFVDDGVTVLRDRPLVSNQPTRLFALAGEVLAFQVVVRGPARNVTVDVEGFAADRFVAHFVHLARRSGSPSGSALGWRKDAAPPFEPGWRADALIPVRQGDVPVGWTCSEPVAGQPVDLVLKHADRYDPDERVPGKRVWIYNGVPSPVRSARTSR